MARYLATIGTFFYGSSGYALHGGRDAKVSPEDGYDGGVVFDGDGKVVRTFKGVGHPACDVDHFANFIRAVRSRKHTDLRADIEEGHFSAALSHVANVSYRLGETMPGSEIRKRLERIKWSSEFLESYDRFAPYFSRNRLDPQTVPLRFGIALAIDSKAELFTGPDSGNANPLLTREYRKGYEVPESANRV